MDPSVLKKMRSDWNDRASEDAYYYVAFGRRKQEEKEFFRTATDEIRWLEREIGRLATVSHLSRALEIGCGPGRLMRPLAPQFAEIHGVDVSDRMIELARRNLAEIPNCHVLANSGADLSPFSSEFFDFVYSYAVFQHIPSRNVVIHYLREAVRVLKLNGIFTCQIDGLPHPGIEESTWAGTCLSAEMLIEFARELNCQVLALERRASQYMWTTWRKRARGWRDAAVTSDGVEILDVRSAIGQWRIPGGRNAEFQVTIKGLDANWDLSDITAALQGQNAFVRTLQHPSPEGLGDISFTVPHLNGTGRTSLKLSWRGHPICDPAEVEVVASKSESPVLISVRDGVNHLSGRRIVCRHVKVILDNVSEPGGLRAAIDGKVAKCSPPVCIDTQMGRHEFNVSLPGSVGPGSHRIEVFHGSTQFPPEQILVGVLQSTDVFRGVPAGERLLEFESGGLCTVVTLLDNAEGSASEAIAAEATNLPFLSGQFAGIVYRRNPAEADWNQMCLLLKEQGALYVEMAASNAESTKDIERQSGLALRWRRDLARPLALRRAFGDREAFNAARCGRALCIALLRFIDRLLGTRFSIGRVGFYFGYEWNRPDLRARLNGCVHCGAVYSSDQLFASAPMIPRYPLVLYVCPSCGGSNIFTADH